MVTRRDAQLYVVSTAGTPQRSPFLWGKVEAGRAAAEAGITHGLACLELSAPEDADPAAVEADIKAKFADWTPKGPETIEPDLGQVAKRGLTVSLVNVPGAQPLTYIAWARPFDDSPDTKAKRRREVVENLALAVLNRRLGRLAAEPSPPFLAADASFENLLHSAKVAAVEAATAPGAWKPARR